MKSSTETANHVIVKAIEPVRVAAIRDVVPDVEQIDSMFDWLFGILEEYIEHTGGAAGPHMAIYHDAGTGPRKLNMHIELAIPFEGVAINDARVRVYELPRVEQMACVVHNGPFEAIGNAHKALTHWAQDSGYRVAGPSREIYLSCGEGDSAHYITEVQFPVAR